MCVQIDHTSATLNKLDESGDSTVSHTSRTSPAGAIEMEQSYLGRWEKCDVRNESWEARDIQRTERDVLKDICNKNIVFAEEDNIHVL